MQKTLFNETAEGDFSPSTGLMNENVRTLPLADCAEIQSGSTPRRSNAEFWGGDVPWVSAKSLYGFRIDDAEEYLTEQGAADGRVVPEDTVLVLVRGMRLAKELAVGITQSCVAFNQDIKALTAKDGILPLYLAYSLKAQEERAMSWADSTTHGTLRLTTEALREIPVRVPPPSEQQAIVDTISTWDRALAEIDAMIEAKEERLKGLRQRLLTGDVRFPEFETGHETVDVDIGEVPQDWEQKKLGDLFDWISDFNRDESVDKVITVGKDAIRDQRDHFNSSVASDNLSGYRIIQPGDFVYDPMSAYYGALGRYDLDETGVVSPAYRVLRLKDGFDSDFVKFLLDSYYVGFRIDAASLQNNKSGKRRGLRQDAFASIKVYLPPSVEEQRRIATFLDAVQHEIDQLRALRDARARQRKGLMQRLLTGEVRV